MEGHLYPGGRRKSCTPCAPLTWVITLAFVFSPVGICTPSLEILTGRGICILTAPSFPSEGSLGLGNGSLRSGLLQVAEGKEKARAVEVPGSLEAPKAVKEGGWTALSLRPLAVLLPPLALWS